MSRASLLVVTIVSVVSALGAGCTLLLPTDQIIKPCTADADCAAGFSCQDNACLPLDQGAEGEGEGEGAAAQ